jgi:hypothetical protein
MTDPSAAYDRLRTETAEMLKLNIADLSLVGGLQLDLVSMLRLEVDGLQGLVLAGEQVDLGRLASALGMLRQLLPEKSLVASPAAASETRFGPEHKARLKALIETTLMAAEVDDPAEAERKRGILAREEMAAIVAAGGAIEPAPSAPATVAPPPPPERPANVVPLHYLREGQREPWRDFHDGRAPTGPHPWPLR